MCARGFPSHPQARGCQHALHWPTPNTRQGPAAYAYSIFTRELAWVGVGIASKKLWLLVVATKNSPSASPSLWYSAPTCHESLWERGRQSLFQGHSDPGVGSWRHRVGCVSDRQTEVWLAEAISTWLFHPASALACHVFTLHSSQKHQRAISLIHGKKKSGLKASGLGHWTKAVATDSSHATPMLHHLIGAILAIAGT